MWRDVKREAGRECGLATNSLGIVAAIGLR